MKITSVAAFILVIIGALNWLGIGLFSFDLVAFLFGSMTILTRIVYVLVGLSAVWLIFWAFIYKPFRNMAK